jgi:plastocyanin
MRARFATFATCTSLTALLAACGGSGAPSTPTTPGGGGGTGQEAITITIPSSDGYGESSFSPGSVTIAVGRTVNWENRDTVVHTTTSNTGVWSGQINPNGTLSHTFSAAGTFDYRCTIHPGMTGSITVQ